MHLTLDIDYFEILCKINLKVRKDISTVSGRSCKSKYCSRVSILHLVVYTLVVYQGVGPSLVDFISSYCARLIKLVNNRNEQFFDKDIIWSHTYMRFCGSRRKQNANPKLYEGSKTAIYQKVTNWLCQEIKQQRLSLLCFSWHKLEKIVPSSRTVATERVWCLCLVCVCLLTIVLVMIEHKNWLLPMMSDWTHKAIYVWRSARYRL